MCIFFDEVFVKNFDLFFLIKLFVFLLLSFKRSLYLLDKRPLSDVFFKYFLPICDFFLSFS